MKPAKLIDAALFVSAFQQAWAQLCDLRGEEIARAYDHDRTWSDFVIGREKIDDAHASLNLFPRTASLLRDAHGIKELRYEDDKIDMAMVAGEACFGDRGWGYASRHCVLIEHENQIERAGEEFYKLLFRVADLKVVAFPNWSTEAIGTARGGDPLPRTLTQFRDLARLAPHCNPTNFLILVAQRAQEHALPNWSWLSTAAWDESASAEIKTTQLALREQAR